MSLLRHTPSWRKLCNSKFLLLSLFILISTMVLFSVLPQWKVPQSFKRELAMDKHYVDHGFEQDTKETTNWLIPANVYGRGNENELQPWKEENDENLPSYLHKIRKYLHGTIHNIIPAPGTISHDEKRPLTILSSVNAGFVDFAVNWLMSMRQIGIRHNVTLIAEDPVAYEYLTNYFKRNATIQIVPTEKHFTKSKSLSFFSKDYLNFVNRRAEYILQFLKKGVDVLHADVDEYWFRDPLTLVQAEYDIYDVWSAIGKDGPCPCLLYLKAKPNVVAMVTDWTSRMKRMKHENDQVALAAVLYRYKKEQRIFHRELEDDLFPTGIVFKIPSWWISHGKRVYVAHANRLGNHEKKKAFFREYRLWLFNPNTIVLPSPTKPVFS